MSDESDGLRCPKCGSKNVWCNGEPGAKHDHGCDACGYRMLPPAEATR